MHGKALLTEGIPCAKAWSKKQRVEAQPNEALGLHCEGNGKPTKVSEQKRDM